VVSKILLPAVVAPVVAGLAAGLAIFFVFRLFRRADQEPAAGWFRRAQTISASMIALAHGTSDGQKTMGVITLVLITAGYQDSGTGPQTWVIACAGLAIGLGTYSGGWRIMRTMGKGLTDLKSPQGFAAETTSAAAILASAHMGFGLSTTQVCSGSVIGSGAGRKFSAVRWGTARRMMYGWLLTLPAAALFGAIAAAIALIGPIGIVIVLAALLAGTATIVSISRRTAVTRHNVNESRDVTVQFGRVTTPPVMAGAGAVAAPAIAPIIIRQPALTPPTNDTTSTGPQT
jgi:PiT family inorganic phosphate transporter